MIPKKNRRTRGRKKRGKGGAVRGGDETRGNSSFGKSNALTLNIKAMPLFAVRRKAMLRYADYFALTSTAGVVASYVFSCNGLYDPNITGTGHQPAGFDQMMLSYEHYVVTRSRICCTYLNTSTTTAPGVALSLEAGATPITNIQQIIEDGMVKTVRLYGAAVAGSMATLNLFCDLAKFGGVVKILDNPEYRGTIAANPAEQSYFHVQVWGQNGDTSVVQVEVVIEYEAWFVEPRNLSQSLRADLTKSLLLEEKRSPVPQVVVMRTR
jgi:hypothetical protein